MNHYPVIIIGGGQAGLSASYGLTQKKINHLVLDRGAIGDTWDKRRWDSFCLVTPNWQCRLPGFNYDGNDPKGFMVKDEIVNYIKRYAASFNPPFKGNVEVYKVFKKTKHGDFSIETSKGDYTAQKVIVATGAYHVQNILSISKGFKEEVIQIHSEKYKNPNQLQEGATLVVGSGQSGAQIAEDIHIAGKKVFLCVGSAPRAPRFYRGRDMVEWLEDMGYYDQPIDSHPDPNQARHKTNHYLTGRDGGRDIDLRKLASEGVVLRGQITGVSEGMVNFNKDLKSNLDGADATYSRIQDNIDAYIKEKGIKAPETPRYKSIWEPDESNNLPIDYKKEGIKNVIWCTGFKVDFNWVKFSNVFDEQGYPIYKRGVTSENGLFFLGLPWLHTWGSGRFSHIGDDAIFITDYIAKELEDETVETCLTKK